MLNSRLLASIIAAAGIGTTAMAQTPLSAIDWLSETVIEEKQNQISDSDVTENAAVREITVRPLDQLLLDSIGLYPAETLNLPAHFWGDSETEDILSALRTAELADTLPAISDFHRKIILMQAIAPQNSDGSVFLARTDALLSLGALDQASALLRASDLDTPELFRRWFDISLLTGQESEACNALRQSGDIAPTYQARIFCLARNGDWEAAALTLNSAETLQVISSDDYDLIARFLDPDLYEGEPYPPTPIVPSPLTFRIYEAIGEAIPTKTLPRAFGHADLRPIVGWKAKIEAAERLAKAFVMPAEKLREIYWERMPAASGDHWDRVRLFQSLDHAIESKNAESTSKILPIAYAEMSRVGMVHILADLYPQVLSELQLDPDANRIAFRLALLSGQNNNVDLPASPTEIDIFLLALANGKPTSVAPINNPQIQAIRDGYDGADPPMSYRLLLREGRLGEALFRAAHDFDAGRDGDLALISRALRLLRHTGQDLAARQFALQYLILDRGL